VGLLDAPAVAGGRARPAETLFNHTTANESLASSSASARHLTPIAIMNCVAKRGKWLRSDGVFHDFFTSDSRYNGNWGVGPVFIPDLLEPIHDELDIHILRVQVNAISSMGLERARGHG
jgi:hypothetical protein